MHTADHVNGSIELALLALGHRYALVLAERLKPEDAMVFLGMLQNCLLFLSVDTRPEQPETSPIPRRD